MDRYLLGCEGLIVHKQEVDIAGVVHEEGLVAGGHEVAGLSVGAVTDLFRHIYQHSILKILVLLKWSFHRLFFAKMLS